MRLAVVGRDRQIDQLVRTAQEENGFDVVVFYPDAPGDRLPGVVARDGWESLTVEPNIDGILIASATRETEARRADQLRTLIHAGTPLLVVHPACEAIVSFELEMQAEAEEVRLLTYRPWADHPVWGRVEPLAVARTH